MKFSTQIQFILLLILPLLGMCQKRSDFVYSTDSIPLMDSIVLRAEFASCGEFGSHTEQIVLVRDVNGFRAKLSREYPCGYVPLANALAKPRDITSSYLSAEDLVFINRYFRSFNVFKMEGNGRYNAHNDFFIKTHRGKTFWLSDWQLVWDEFTPLKNKLFEINCKSQVK